MLFVRLHKFKCFQALLCITKNSIQYQSFAYTQLNDEILLLLTTHFGEINCLHSVWMWNSFIWPIDRTLLGATTLGQSGPGSEGNECVVRIPQSCSITGSSPSDCHIRTPRQSVIFWPSTRPKNAIPRWCTGRKWHIPMASNRKRSRGRIKVYNMGQGEGPTVPLQWCIGREWPVNCMTVISAWWRLNIRFQRSNGRSCGRWIII